MSDPSKGTAPPRGVTRRSLFVYTGIAAVLPACGTAASDLADTGADASVDRPDAGIEDRAAVDLGDTGADLASDAGADVATDLPRPDVPAVECTLDAGPVSDYGVGTFRQFTSHHVIVGRDEAGLLAFTSVCTHEGCDVGIPNTDGEIVCPCHDSRYNSNGDVTGGPAKRSLLHVRLALVTGRVCVDPSAVEADRALRVPVA